mgnify:FL=1
MKQFYELIVEDQIKTNNMNIYEKLAAAGIGIMNPNTGNYHCGKCGLRLCTCVKNTHGGKRPNSERKKKYKEETETISFRVPKSLIEPITKYVKRALAKSKK